MKMTKKSNHLTDVFGLFMYNYVCLGIDVPNYRLVISS